MKRDMDLVRKILLKLEDTSYPEPDYKFTIEGFCNDDISYNVMLLSEANLIEAMNTSALGYFKWIPRRLTWAGHEFLDAARDNNRWEAAKKLIVEKGGNLAFDVIKSVLISLMTKAVLG
jgi:hypothetical protein